MACLCLLNATGMPKGLYSAGLMIFTAPPVVLVLGGFVRAAPPREEIFRLFAKNN